MIELQTGAGVRQRAELTFRFNREAGRHGWLRLTPAYSLRLVRDILKRQDAGIRVLDPFSGTGTTPLCAAERGDRGTGIEINPFLVWLSRAKLAHYSPRIIAECRVALEHIVASLESGQIEAAPPPALYNISRWWSARDLSCLCQLRAAIGRYSEGQGADLLLVAFCRQMIELSNAAFNHQSMSFKDASTQDALPAAQGMLFDLPSHAEAFGSQVESVLRSAQDNPTGQGSIVLGDARWPSKHLDSTFDLLITSPPYPNRISYIRELRPYMYWLGYLRDGRDAGELDWSTTGGTWGIATSRLAAWEPPTDAFQPAYLQDAVQRIRQSDNKSSALLANYVAKYFADMWEHIRNVGTAMAYGAELHYIVGNSSFYGVLVPVERVYLDMLQEAGFRNGSISVLRKRNSKKELYEFDVSARK